MVPLDDQDNAHESALRALEERLTRASDAAERLISEAASAAARGVAGVVNERPDPASAEAPDPPPAGWAAAGQNDAGDSSTAQSRLDGELAPLLEFVRSLRDLVPADLQRRLAEAVRELLLAVRALIDWYLERMEHRRATPTRVEDIPIL